MHGTERLGRTMYDELVKRLRHDSESRALMREAADAIEELSLIAESNERSAARWAETAGKAVERYEELDRHAITLQHEMMAEAESHIALVERLNKQVEELQKQVAHWQRELVKSMCEVTLIESEKPRWIPVTERLPDESGNYLTAFGGGTAMAVNEFMHPRDWLTEEGREANLNGKWYWGGVTHWMELPELPKEEDNG